jgi:hypothetical protein
MQEDAAWSLRNNAADIAAYAVGIILNEPEAIAKSAMSLSEPAVPRAWIP